MVEFEVKSYAKETLQEFENACYRGLEMIGMQAEGYAAEALTRQKAVDTGRLRNSITHSTKIRPANHAYTWDDSTKGRSGKAGSGVTKSQGGEEEFAVYIGTNVNYASHIEFGTSKIRARPYLRPAAADHVAEYKKMLESQLRS